MEDGHVTQLNMVLGEDIQHSGRKLCKSGVNSAPLLLRQSESSGNHILKILSYTMIKLILVIVEKYLVTNPSREGYFISLY